MADESPCDRCGQPMEEVGFEYERARETGHDVQPADRRRRLRCPACSYEKTLAETVPAGEIESWENEGGSAWGKDEGPWEG